MEEPNMRYDYGYYTDQGDKGASDEGYGPHGSNAVDDAICAAIERANAREGRA